MTIIKIGSKIGSKDKELLKEVEVIILIAITAKGERLEAKFDNRFGRCEYIAFCEYGSEEHKFKENPSKYASGGAGISTAEFLAANDVKVVITGNVGPKAMRALNAANIEVFTATDGTVKEKLREYHDDKLEKTDKPTVEGGRNK